MSIYSSPMPIMVEITPKWSHLLIFRLSWAIIPTAQNIGAASQPRFWRSSHPLEVRSAKKIPINWFTSLRGSEDLYYRHTKNCILKRTSPCCFRQPDVLVGALARVNNFECRTMTGNRNLLYLSRVLVYARPRRCFLSCIFGDSSRLSTWLMQIASTQI